MLKTEKKHSKTHEEEEWRILRWNAVDEPDKVRQKFSKMHQSLPEIFQYTVTSLSLLKRLRDLLHKAAASLRLRGQAERTTWKSRVCY